MATDPAIERIRSRTPLYRKVSVSKVFDLVEEVNAALARTNHTPEWLAEKIGISLEELTNFLSGMDPFYDPIARLEAAFEQDLFIGATQGGRYFDESRSFENTVVTNKSSFSHKQKIVLSHTSSVDDKFDVLVWDSGESVYRRTVSGIHSSQKKRKSYEPVFN